MPIVTSTTTAATTLRPTARPSTGVEAAPTAPAVPLRSEPPPEPPVAGRAVAGLLDGETPSPLRGAGARIVENMEASLGVPTATSVRTVPAKLLEVNRQILNNHLNRIGRGKVSFTHLIAYAVGAGRPRGPGDELGLRCRTARRSWSATST